MLFLPCTEFYASALKFSKQFRETSRPESEYSRIFISNDGSTLPSLPEIIANFSTNSTKSNTSCGIFIETNGNVNGQNLTVGCAFKEMLPKRFFRAINEYPYRLIFNTINNHNILQKLVRRYVQKLHI